MDQSYEFLSFVLDAITESIVVIDPLGEIKYVNRSWSQFGQSNSGTDTSITSNAQNACQTWIGMNYLDVCDNAAAMGDEFGSVAGKGIRGVISEGEDTFYFEYPCHSPNEKRWFTMRVTPLHLECLNYFVISHQDITDRKLAEEKVMSLAKMDGLINIPNRRAFDEFLADEWQRCTRLKKPISLAIIDIDHFKTLNDTYGHQKGDECLIALGTLFQTYVKRPSDLCARYGGEEFILVWGDTLMSHSLKLMNDLLQKIDSLKIPNSDDISNYLTVSIGLTEITPTTSMSEVDIIAQADRMLYEAKRTGRNKVVY
ncbi:sensor domain-containing diguanylate cyclase [Marinomonas colpomeniae]|uniref:diguanylate cyclase n=1 Tax=Marinomonas colpomeniae TaxID=2774408 RepID=A0ABR8P1W4_9GAMM|nr:diguanylate cyclase [Marinomonas colpomeniae]MBD5771438.1 diguanylate cyclase [Marinomonas colpomeniae]